MRSLLDCFLEFKFKSNRIFLDGISIFQRVARIPVSGEISEISVEKKNLGPATAIDDAKSMQVSQHSDPTRNFNAVAADGPA
jgi:hypothetical protein